MLLEEPVYLTKKQLVARIFRDFMSDTVARLDGINGVRGGCNWCGLKQKREWQFIHSSARAVETRPYRYKRRAGRLISGKQVETSVTTYCPYYVNG